MTSAAPLTAEWFTLRVPYTYAFLDDLRITVDDNFVSQLASRVGPIFFDLTQADTGASLAGPAWRDFLDSGQRNDEVTVAWIHVVLAHLEEGSSASQASFRAAGLNGEMSLLYALFRLGAVLHDLGRMTLATDPHRARGFLVAELELFRRLRDQRDRLSRDTQYRMLGMAGVAQTFLSRATTLSAEDLTAARTDLVKSIELGNEPVQALQYLVELDMRLYDVDGDARHLRASLSRVDRLHRKGQTSRLLLLASAEARLRLAEHDLFLSRAQPLSRHRKIEDVSTAFVETLRDLDLARKHPTEDEFDRTRLEMLAAITEAKKSTIDRGADDVGLSAIGLRGLRLPQTLRALVRNAVTVRAADAELVLRQSISAMEVVTSAEPTSAAWGVLAHFLRSRRRMTGSASDARATVEALSAARHLGDRSAENLSLTADEQAFLWRRTRDPRYFASAVEAAALAAATTPAWGWPLVHLAELADEAAKHQRLWGGEWKESIESSEAKVNELVDLVHIHDASGLLVLAAERAVAAHRAPRRALGGRGETYVLNDLHGLLEHVFVLKPADRFTSERERDQTVVIADFLRDRDMPRWMIIPDCVGVFDGPDDTCLYVMRREAGDSLQDLVCTGDLDSELLSKAVGRCVRFLATIHVSWWTAPDEREEIRNRARRDSAVDLQYHLRGLGLDDATRRAFKRRWQDLIPAGAPALRKRDAHAGNWIVTRAGGIVAVDLASSKHRPYLYELVQLLDDWPMLPVSNEGWEARMQHARSYTRELRRLGLTVADLDENECYALSAIARMVFIQSRTAITEVVHGYSPAGDQHQHHAVDLLEFIRERFDGTQVGDLAADVATAIRDAHDRLVQVPTLPEHVRVRLSRLFAKVLRHRPDIAAVVPDGRGWVQLDAFVSGLAASDVGVDEATVAAVVNFAGENRFALENGMIRARYGHSIPVKMAPDVGAIPPVLYHGTSAVAINQIIGAEEGLVAGSRQFVHLVDTVDSARRVGARHGEPIVLVVDALGLAEAGFKIESAAADVWIVEAVPAEFLSFAEASQLASVRAQSDAASDDARR